MTGLLVSVRNLEEARLAHAGEADIIDIKEPAQGALGAVALQEVRRIVDWFGERDVPLSATVGDLPSDPVQVLPVVTSLHAIGVDYVKVGLLQPDQYRLLLQELQGQAQLGVKIILVVFADRVRNVAPILECARHCDLAGVMLDTADKTLGSLRTLWSDAALDKATTLAQRLGLLFGLAGSLRTEDVDPLLTIAPDYLGFRGAVCDQARRTGELDSARLTALRARIPRPDGKHETYRVLGGKSALGG